MIITDGEQKEDKSTSNYAGILVVTAIVALVAIRSGMVKVK